MNAAGATYLQLLPSDIISRELLPILKQCERPPPDPPKLKLWAKVAIFVFSLLASVLLITTVVFAWPVKKVDTTASHYNASERLCAPYICDWIPWIGQWGNSSHGYGYCDGNQSNSYWSVVVNGYASENQWGYFPWNEFGPINVCPGYSPQYPSIYYGGQAPFRNGTTCYKPSEACAGEDWINDYVATGPQSGGNCQPLVDCTMNILQTFRKDGVVVFIVVSIPVFVSAFVFFGVLLFVIE